MVSVLWYNENIKKLGNGKCHFCGRLIKHFFNNLYSFCLFVCFIVVFTYLLVLLMYAFSCSAEHKRRYFKECIAV